MSELPDNHWIKETKETFNRVKKILDDHQEGILNGAPRTDPFLELEDGDRDSPDPEQPDLLRGR